MSEVDFLKDGHAPIRAIDKTLKVLGDFKPKEQYEPPKERITSGRPTSSALVEKSRLYRNIKTYEKISTHCGYGFSKRDMIFVQNNAINNSPIRQKLYRDPFKMEFSGTNFNTGDIRGLKFLEEPSESTKITKKFEEEMRIKSSQKKSLDTLKRDIDMKDLQNLEDKRAIEENLIKYYQSERSKISCTLNEELKKEQAKVNKIFIPNPVRSPSATKTLSRNGSKLSNFFPGVSKQESSNQTGTVSTLENRTKLETNSSKSNNQNDLLAILFPYTKDEFFPQKTKAHV